jgi:hypothetical protein
LYYEQSNESSNIIIRNEDKKLNENIEISIHEYDEKS